MNRSHRLLSAVHRLRLDRLEIAENKEAYEAFAELKPLGRHLRDLNGDGYIDWDIGLHEVTAVIDMLIAQWNAEHQPGGVVAIVGGMIAAAAFAGRLQTNGHYILGGSDRYVAEGCGTLAEAAVLDRIQRAVAEVMRRRALIDHRKNPCWPKMYLQRRAEAERATLACPTGAVLPVP